MIQEIRSLADLMRVLSEDEHEHLEFKEAKNGFSVSRLTEYCAALCNEGGGAIVFGVADKRPRQIVGTRAFENLQATKKQLFDALHLRVDLVELIASEGRIVVANVPARPKGTPVHVEGRYLARVGESIVAMSPDQLRRIFSEEALLIAKPAVQKGFRCGTRIRRVREDLQLSASHIVDLVGFPSESLWLEAERGRAELTSAQLEALAHFSGANVSWLKHGEEPVYRATPVYDISWREDLKGLFEAKGAAEDGRFSARVALDPVHMRCAVLCERTDYRIDVFKFTFDLDFWRWADGHAHIPEIWRCLNAVRTDLHIQAGLIVPRKIATDFFDGRVYPKKIYWSSRSQWFEDLFDLQHRYRHLASEYKVYGEWFSNLQSAVRMWGSPRGAE